MIFLTPHSFEEHVQKFRQIKNLVLVYDYCDCYMFRYKLIDDFRQSPDIGKTKELWYVICLYYVLKTLYISHHWAKFGDCKISERKWQKVTPSVSNPSREKCLYSEFFWSKFFGIRAEYWDLLRKSPYSVLMRENMDQKNSEYRHFLSDNLQVTETHLEPCKTFAIELFCGYG